MQREEFLTLHRSLENIRKNLVMVIFLAIGSLALNLTQWGSQSEIIQSTSNRVTTMQFDLQAIQRQLVDIQREGNGG